MIIRVKKTWKDFIEGDPNHARLSRRDFIERGLLTGAMSVAVPSAFFRSALGHAACPQPVRATGGLGQFYCDGGGSMFAYLMNNQMADAAANSTAVANNYGIDGANLRSVGGGANGGNLVVAVNSAFGAALLAGAPGYTQAEWAAVLAKCSLGTIVGPLNADDAGMPNNMKVGGGVGKISAGKDITAGNSTPISWAVGTPAAAVNNLTVTNLARTYSITPAGQTNAQTMTNSATAAQSLSALFGGIFGLDKRKAGNTGVTSASCGFFGDAALTDPTFGSQLFDTAVGSDGTMNAIRPVNTGLTATESAMLAAFARSCDGSLGAVTIDRVGYDYHGNGNVAPQQIQAARALVMFLAACDRTGQKGAFIMASNGSAIGGGPRAQANQTIGGNSLGVTTINVQDTTPQGDSGGFFNKVDVLFYSPAGTPPVAKSVGTINPASGSVTSDPSMTSVLNAISSAYLSAAMWLGTQTVDSGKLKNAISRVGGQTKITLI